MTSSNSQDPVRHILSLSGGKDSTALAIYMRDRVPQMEYIFCDTGEELSETYDYLEKLEAYLGKKIEKLNPDRPFSHHLQVFRGVLPDARTRWCTRKLKIEPFERYVGDSFCYSYIGIRADELHRKGYISTKPNIHTLYPFIDDGLNKQDVFRILEESGLGLPKYYEWRSRSGCYFCFFQQRAEWVGLLNNHPEKFQEAMEFERVDPATGETYTWSPGESLKEIMQPERQAQIQVEHERRLRTLKEQRVNQTLTQVFGMEDVLEEGDSCLICHL